MYVPPFSMPLTRVSETFLSMSFNVSFALSTADFRAGNEVEKVRETIGSARTRVTRRRKDMVCCV